MELSHLIHIADYDSLTTRERIRLFAWYLHTFQEKAAFSTADILDCYRKIHEKEAQASVYLTRMANYAQADVLRVKGGYKLVGKIRKALDDKYGTDAGTVQITKLLAELPSKIPNMAEKAFLEEALKCYRVQAYRAASVMVWNLAYDHLAGWIMADKRRLKKFNDAIPKRFPKKTLSVAVREDIEEFKEAEFIEVCATAGITTKNVTEILREKLKRRNAAAHPSNVIITQSQTDDTITDLINNVVLKFA